MPPAPRQGPCASSQHQAHAATQQRWRHDLRACHLPRGRVRLLAVGERGLTNHSDYEIKRVIGAIVLLDQGYGDQYISYGSLAVWNVRTGRRYYVASGCGGAHCDPPEGTTAPVAFVNARGQAVAAKMRARALSTTIVTTYSPQGERFVVDTGSSSEIPPASLKLAGSTATWTHAGQPRTAVLPE